MPAPRRRRAGSPSQARAVEPHLALAGAVDGPRAARARGVQRDQLDIGVVGRQQLGLGAARAAAPAARTRCRRRTRTAPRRRAAGARESYATSPSCGVRWVERPARGVDEEEVVVERRVRALHEDAVLATSRRRATSRPAARARARSPPASATTATSKSTPLRPVWVKATRAPSGENAPGTWIASGSSRERQLGAAGGVEREERVALVAAGVARDHPALLARRGQRGRDALARERRPARAGRRARRARAAAAR